MQDVKIKTTAELCLLDLALQHQDYKNSLGGILRLLMARLAQRSPAYVLRHLDFSFSTTPYHAGESAGHQQRQ